MQMTLVYSITLRCCCFCCLCVCVWGGHPMQSFSIMHHIDARACEFYNITVPVN